MLLGIEVLAYTLVYTVHAAFDCISCWHQRSEASVDRSTTGQRERKKRGKDSASLLVPSLFFCFPLSPLV